jgi:hypothetical protein
MDRAHARSRRADRDPYRSAARPDLRLVRPGDAAPVLPDEPPYVRDPVTGRRTVKITGQAPAPRRRPTGAARQVGSRPDRVAMWAVILGLLLVFMSAATARGDTPAPQAAPAPQIAAR